MYPPSMQQEPRAGAGRWETTGNPQHGERNVDENPSNVAVISTLISVVVGALLAMG